MLGLPALAFGARIWTGAAANFQFSVERGGSAISILYAASSVTLQILQGRPRSFVSTAVRCGEKSENVGCYLPYRGIVGLSGPW
jgi:hypothetical protein